VTHGNWKVLCQRITKPRARGVAGEGPVLPCRLGGPSRSWAEAKCGYVWHLPILGATRSAVHRNVSRQVPARQVRRRGPLRRGVAPLRRRGPV